MAVVSISDVLENAQTYVWNSLKNDSSITSITKNILDGVPLGLTHLTGFPYIIVPTPTVSSTEFLTFGDNNNLETLTFEIKVFDRKESISRQLGDLIRSNLASNVKTFRNDYGLYHFITSSVSTSFTLVEDGFVVYELSLNVDYEWVPQ